MSETTKIRIIGTVTTAHVQGTSSHFYYLDSWDTWLESQTLELEMELELELELRLNMLGLNPARSGIGVIAKLQ